MDFEKIKRAVEQRNQFLAENPQLEQLQEKINKVLAKAGKDPYKRQVALQELILNKWYEIVHTWEDK